MGFELRLALRHLKAGGWQTVLILGGVGMAVTLVIFITGLITGLQEDLVNRVAGSTAHVIVEAPERAPQVAYEAGEDTLVVSKRQQRVWQPDTIDDCRCLEARLRTFKHVTAVSPSVSGQALITRAGREFSVQVVGADPGKQDKISRVSEDLLEGSYLALDSDEAVIGYDLRQDLNVQLGDRVRVTTAGGDTATYRVAGVFYTGQQQVDQSTVYVTLRAGQTLFGTGTMVTRMSLKVDDVFLANQVADAIASAMDLDVDTWMRQNPNLLDAIEGQNRSVTLISAFSLIASGFAIASVLIVSVLKRSKEIGILKAIGARGRQILLVFTLESLMVGVGGATLGALAGTGLILLIQSVLVPSRIPGAPPEQVLPGIVNATIVIRAMVAAIIITLIAGVTPARRAANLDAVKVIQGG
ncbi:MAG TPA: ABC transporter permease [Armatimonadota bacterium]|nr:ABC transporter permease [Armatimonadota bacterium]